MIEIPQNAGAAASSPAVAPAAPAGSGPSPSGAGGDAAFQERQAAADALVAAGQMTKEQADAWLAPPAPVDNSVGSATPTMLEEISAFAAGASRQDAESLLDWEMKAGRISKGQRDKILAGRAAPVDTTGSNVTPESVAALTTAAKAAEIDAAFPPAKAGQFDMPIFTDEHGSAESEAAFNAAAGARAALETAGFTKEIGGYLAKEIASVQKEWTGLDDTGQELYRRTQMAQLERMWNEKAPEKIALAQQLVRELEAKHPGVMDLLDMTGAANSATVIAQVVAHAERLLAKRGLTALPK